MSDVLNFRSLASIEEEAAAWVWRLDDESLAPQERAAFEKWLRRDVRHRQAFEELGGVWASLDSLAEAKRDERIATFMAQERRLLTAERPRAPGWRKWAAAAAFGSLAIAGALSWLVRGGDEERMLATAVGQQHSEMLADGSTVQLNTNSMLETRFEPSRRLVHLRKGEAAFKVAPDAERPFVVHAGDMVVRAIGTEFNVRLHEGQILEVIVTEGRVAVEPWKAGEKAASAAVASKQLVAGQRLSTSTTQAVPAVTQVAHSAITKTLAWREGAIVFDGEPLVDAIAELNRYTDHRMMVVDPVLHQMRVGGRFRAGDIEGFLEALVRALPVKTRRTPEGVVYIEAVPGQVSRQ